MEGRPNLMWTVVYLAHGKQEADKIQNALTEQCILVKVKSIGKAKNGNGIFEILVPQLEVEDAYAVLSSLSY
jgi:hypothetical protein